MKLAEGSYFAKDGTNLLKRYQSSEFIGSEGLEAGFGRYPYFAPAARRIGLARHKAITLPLRDPVTKQEVHIEMAPRTVSTEVQEQERIFLA